MSKSTCVLETNVSNYPVKRGKVRDVYDLGAVNTLGYKGEKLLIVATDRISAFDYVLANGIPEKGKVLTNLTLFWLDFLQCKSHLITPDQKDFPSEFQTPEFADRSMLVKKLKVIPYECIVRGYLCGSAWQEYQKHGTIAGKKMPKGLRQNQQFPKPMFTPSTKAESGHDENITFEQLEKDIGYSLANALRYRSIELYQEAAQHAWEKGIIIADTKFEWGMHEKSDYYYEDIFLIDEVLTPDSSRFWPLDQYQFDVSMPSFDKQYVRDWLTNEANWDKNSPPPELPEEVANVTSQKYLEAYEKLTAT